MGPVLSGWRRTDGAPSGQRVHNIKVFAEVQLAVLPKIRSPGERPAAATNMKRGRIGAVDMGLPCRQVLAILSSSCLTRSLPTAPGIRGKGLFFFPLSHNSICIQRHSKSKHMFLGKTNTCDKSKSKSLTATRGGGRGGC